MRAVTFADGGLIQVVDRPIPEITPDQVLLRVRGAGLCHSDLHIVKSGENSPLMGAILGHEVSGVVERVGQAATGWQVGDLALVALVLSCGHCRQCLAGRDNQCEVVGPRDSLAPLSPGIGAPGGMAEYLAVSTHHLDPLGSLDPVDAAPLADAGVTPMHAISSVGDRLCASATVVVAGLGGLGHLGLQILAATSAARIIALDSDPAKVAAATGHGADLGLLSDASAVGRILEETDGRGADVVLDFVCVQATMDLALAVIAVGGAIRFVGLGGGSFTWSAGATSLPWGVNIERAYGGNRSDQHQVLALAQAGKISVDVTRYPLEDAARAFADLEAGRVPGRAVLVP